MTDLIEKARLGRTNALAGMAGSTSTGPGFGARLRSSNRHEKVTFISSRARTLGDTFLG
jgi:hypothetical protein